MKKFILLLFVIFLSIIAKSQQVSLYAGTPNTSGYTSGTTLTNSKFNLPWGIAIDKNGNIWVSEVGGHTIRMITPSGYVYVRAGQYGINGFFNASGITSKFDNPKGIAIGPNNEIYVADFSNHCIRKITPFVTLGNAQTISIYAGKYATGSTNYTSYPGYADGSASNAQFYFPSGVACDDTGNVYVADNYNHCIRKISTSGTVTTIAGQPKVSGSTDGNAKTTAKFNYPSDLFIYGSSLYITDNANSRLRKLNLSNGTVSTVDSNLWTPNGLTIWNNTFYIADQHRIMKLLGSNLLTYCGSVLLNQSGYTNGYGNSTRFYNVKGIMLNPNDTNLYVTDMDNHVIRKVSVCPNINVNLTITGDTTFCDGDSVIIVGPGGYSKYEWSNGATTQSVTIKSTINLKLTVRTADSCAGLSRIVQITKKKRPTSSFFIDSTFCLNQNDTIIYTGNGISTASYIWSFDSANIVSGSGNGPYIINWNQKGIKNISLKVTENGCTSTTTNKTATVYELPVSTFTINQNACQKINDTVTFTGIASAAAQYSWNFDGASLVSGSGKGPYIVKWTTSGTKNVSLIVTDHNCLSSKTTIAVNVFTPPVASMIFNNKACEGKDDTFTFNGTAGTTAQYFWDFNGGNIVSGSGKGPYIVNWSILGSKAISLEVIDNGCISNTAKATATVKKTPDPYFNLNKNVCSDQPDTITYTGNGSSTAAYTWNFDGAGIYSGSGQGPFIVYWSSAGEKNVTLQVEEDGCISGIKLEKVTVNEAPVSLFSMKTLVCADEIITVTFIGSASAAANYKWDFGAAEVISGSGKGPYQIKWNSEGNKKVSLTVEETSCNSLPYSLDITVKKKPTSTFSVPFEVCEGKEANIIYTGNGISSANFNWNFDGATIKSGTGIGPFQVIWNNPGIKSLTLTVNENGCISSITTNQVNVIAKPPVPSISRKGDTLISSSDSNNQWYDQKGIINGANMKKFTPPTDGSYYVIVTNSKGCSSQSANYNFLKSDVKIDDNETLKVYPNPFNNELFIEFSSDEQMMTVGISLLNMEGKVILNQSSNEPIYKLCLKELPIGLYLLQLQNKYGIKYIKVIKTE